MRAVAEALLDEELRLGEEIATARAQQGLLAFTTATYGPGWQTNWHHRAICRAVNYVEQRRTPRELLASFGIKGKELLRQLKTPHPVTKLYAGMTRPEMLDEPLRNLQVHVHPRAGKSQLISRHMPAWLLGRDPNLQIISCSYGAELSQAMNRDVQRIIDEPSYAHVFPKTRLRGGAKGVGADGNYLRNSDIFEIMGHRGFYKNAGVGGPITGRGCGVALIDDPIRNRADAESEKVRKTIAAWYQSTLYTRLERHARQYLIQTRWHERDLSGVVTAQAQADPTAEQWFCLVYPALLDCDPTPGDPRKKHGEALWPWKVSAERLARIRATTSTYEFNSLFQQRPAALEGGIVKLSWFNYWTALPEGLTKWTLSGDLTFNDRNDYTVLQVWASKGADHYLVDQIRDRQNFTGQLKTFASLCAKYPQIQAKLIEDAANGAALVDTVKKKIPGVIGVRPQGSKSMRLDAVSPLIEAGNVYLPAPSRCAWVDSFLDEVATFPNGAHDDVVDAMSLYLSRAQKRRGYTEGGVPITMSKQSYWREGPMQSE